MKKMITALLAAILCLGLAACAGDTPDDTAAPDSVLSGPVISAEPTTVSQPLPTEEPEPVWINESGITASLLQSVYPEGIQKLTLVLDNTSGQELSYSPSFSCEKYVDGTWKAMDWGDGPVYDMMLRTVQPHSAGEMVLDLTFLAEPLDEGFYRFTGSPMWLGQDDQLPAWQVILRIAPDAQPEPDYALYISAQPIPTVDGCLVTDRLPVLFINTTGKDGQVVDIPHLEKLDETGEWMEVSYKDRIGFCGTPSRLPADGRPWSEDISYLWGALEDGQYRLSYNTDSDASTGQSISGTFTLYTPEDNHGLPLFTSVEVFRNEEDATGVLLSEEDSSTILTILQNGDWQEGTADCINDYRFTVSGSTIYYHSDCGTFNDSEANRSFTVSEEDRAVILSLLP
ncbi:MAG: hypothetical protein HDT15_03410 [Oscillibacter sp.]|nr:hypothetical protein [Oscillibacter sp.]